MLATTTYKNETWRDLAVRLYGNIDAVLHLVTVNQQLFADGDEVDITDVLPEGTVIYYAPGEFIVPVEAAVETAAQPLVYTTIDNQTWRDLAVQLYGNPDAVLQLVALNPQLFENDTEVDITARTFTGTAVNYDEDKNYFNKKAIQKLGGAVLVTGFTGRYFDDYFELYFE